MSEIKYTELTDEERAEIMANIQERGHPLVSDFINLDELQTHLMKLSKTVNWKFPPYQYHYDTSPSGYFRCPYRDDETGTNFVMVRGSKFHDWLGPYIPRLMGLKDLEYSVEPMFAIPVNCPKCGDKFIKDPLCQSNQFPFGGSLDLPIWTYEWLIDLKFSMQSPEKMQAYTPQIIAYKNLANYGFERQEPAGKKAEWKWQQSKRKLTYLTLLHINPDTFKCTEVPINPEELPFPDMVKMIKEHHLAKVHNALIYRPDPYCDRCRNAKKPRLILYQEKRGEVHKYIKTSLSVGEGQEIMIPHVEPSCIEAGRYIKPMKTDHGLDKFKLSKAPVVEKKTSKRNVTCVFCEEKIKEYYRRNRINHCIPCWEEICRLEREPVPDKIKNMFAIYDGNGKVVSLLPKTWVVKNIDKVMKDFKLTPNMLKDQGIKIKDKEEVEDNSDK